MIKRLLATILFLIAFSSVASTQGLKFLGMECPIDERSSYDVFSKHIPRFRDSLEISFDYMPQPRSRFGYVFRVSNLAGDGHIWNMSFDRRSGDVVVRINDEGFRSSIYAEIPSSKLPDFKWVRVSVVFHAAGNRVSLTIGDNSYEGELLIEGNVFRPSIQFGISGHVVDSPSFSIKDLVITDGTQRFCFPMNEFTGRKVHDSRGHARGSVINPLWMAEEASRWTEIATIESDSPSGNYFNDKTHEIGIYSGRTLKTLNIASGSESERAFANPCPLNILSGTSFISGDRLYAYELFDWVRGPGEASVASLDFGTMTWETLSRDRLDGPMHHNAAFFNPQKVEQTFFGGYGNIYFNGDFISLGEDWCWHRNDVDRTDAPGLYPRFFCSAGVDQEGKYAYIFGGLGNETGEEVVGRRYFYDLHRYDLRTGECRYMWTADWQEEPSVPARGLIIDGQWMYALCYPEYMTKTTMHLYRFNLENGSYQMLDSGIEVTSDKIWSSSSMFLDKSLGKIVVICRDVDRQYVPKTGIYTLSYPPIMNAGRSWVKEHAILLQILIAFILIALASGLIAFHAIRRKRQEQQDRDDYVKAMADFRKRVYTCSQSPNSILLFGDFTVLDHNGDDITGLFSPQLKTLLLLLVKYSEKGLSSSRMSRILWPDKEDNKSRNSRGVAVNSIRRALKNVEGLALEYRDGHYFLDVSEEMNCDFIRLKSHLAEGNSEEALSILSRGRFLKDVQDPVFDSFKAEVESLVLPFLEDQMKEKSSKGQRRAAVEIADMTIECDPLNERALKTSVSSLLSLGRREDALLRYSAFAIAWQNLEGEPYPVRFDDLAATRSRSRIAPSGGHSQSPLKKEPEI